MEEIHAKASEKGGMFPCQLVSRASSTVSFLTNQPPKTLEVEVGIAYYCKLSFGMTLSYVGPRCIVFDLRKYPGPQAWNRSVLFRASQQRYRDESPGMGERNV